MRPRVKICGLTRPEDARLAARLGATHVGCVMVPRSPRCVSPERAREIFEASGDGLRHVLVFRREPPEFVLEAARTVGTAHVQIYDFTEEQARLLETGGLTVYRVYDVAPGSSRLPRLDPLPSEERPAVVDVGGGGSGSTFAWRILGERAPHATFIAGGVRPTNVAALMRHKPYGVDLSSGVESAPGIKDHGLLRVFFEELDQSL